MQRSIQRMRTSLAPSWCRGKRRQRCAAVPAPLPRSACCDGERPAVTHELVTCRGERRHRPCRRFWRTARSSAHSAANSCASAIIAVSSRVCMSGGRARTPTGPTCTVSGFLHRPVQQLLRGPVQGPVQGVVQGAAEDASKVCRHMRESRETPCALMHYICLHVGMATQSCRDTGGSSDNPRRTMHVEQICQTGCQLSRSTNSPHMCCLSTQDVSVVQHSHFWFQRHTPQHEPGPMHKNNKQKEHRSVLTCAGQC